MMIPMMMLASTACRQQVEKAPAIDMTDMDLTVSPGDDFFQYANGGWIKKNPLKPEYARFGSFDVLRENNVVRLNDLFAEMAMITPEAGTVDQKIVDLYKQGLDSVKLNAEGGQPLQTCTSRDSTRSSSTPRADSRSRNISTPSMPPRTREPWPRSWLR